MLIGKLRNFATSQLRNFATSQLRNFATSQNEQDFCPCLINTTNHTAQSSPSAAGFYAATKNCRKLAVIDCGLLGDTVHIIPALNAIRQAYPRAELHVVTAAHVVELLRLLPWVDRVWGYPRFSTAAPLWRTLLLTLALRREHFDATICLLGQDRAMWLSFFTGAPCRLARVPPARRKRPRPHWRWCFTHRVNHAPVAGSPVYLERFRFLAKVGIPVREPAAFPVVIPDSIGRRAGELTDHERGFVHVSPFTTSAERELSPARLAEFLNTFHRQRPAEKIAISCAPTSRELEKLKSLTMRLDFTPWKIFAGALDAAHLAAVISRAKLHLGGDSGGIHVALMMGVPSVCWFREKFTGSGFAPRGPHDRVIYAADGDDGFLDLPPEKILAALPEEIFADNN